MLAALVFYSLVTFIQLPKSFCGVADASKCVTVCASIKINFY